MFDFEGFFKNLNTTWNEFVQDLKPKTEETIIDMNSKKIQIDLPAPPPAGGFSGSPSGDNDYDEALAIWHKKVNAIILEAIPLGYKLKASEVKEEKIVRHFAEIVVEKS